RPVERTCLALSDIIVLFVVGLTGIASAEFIASSWGERTPIFQIPAALIALPLPLGMALLALYAANNLYRENRRLIWGLGVGFIIVWGLAAATRDVWLGWLGDDAAIIVALALFFLAIFAGVPVGFVLLLATATYLWAADAASFVVLPQTMVNGTGNFILLAVPFFILAGLVMERGGISVRLVRFIYTLVGHWRGGVPQGPVAGMYVVSRVFWSQPADVGGGRHGHARSAARAPWCCRGRGRPGRFRNHGRNSSAQHRHAHRWVDHQRIACGTVHRRAHSRSRDGVLPDGAHLCARSPRRYAPRAARVFCHHIPRRTRCGAAAANARYVTRRDSIRGRHPD